MTGLSTFSKSPLKDRQPTCKLIKPVVDESIESMHIVTVDLQVTQNHESFACPPNSQNQQVNYPISNPVQSSQSCAEGSECMPNIDSVTGIVKASFIDQQMRSRSNDTCSCSACQASHTYEQTATASIEQLQMSTKICLETTLYECNYI